MQSSSSSSSMDSGYQIISTSAAKKFITAYENGHNTSAMQNALLELQREGGDEHLFASRTYPQLLSRFDQILSSAAETKEVGTLVSLILKYVNDLAITNEKLRVALRDDYSFLNHLSSIINPNEIEYLELMMESTDLISRGIQTSWKAPYLQGIINKCVIVILNDQMKPNICEYALQILINLCKQNSSCVMIVRQHTRFNEIWIYFRKLLLQNSNNILVSHLLYLLEPTIPVDNFISGYEMVGGGTEKVLAKWKASGAEDILELEIAKEMMKVRQLMESILDKMRPLYESINAKNEKPIASQSQRLSLEHQVLEDIKGILLTKLNSIRDFINTPFVWSGLIVNELLQFILVFFPEHTQRIFTADFYMVSFEIVDGIVSKTEDDVKTFTFCMKVFHHLTKHMSLLDSPKKSELGANLTGTLNRVKLIEEDTQDALERNTTCLQLMSCLSELQATNKMVYKKLDLDTMGTILDILSREDSSIPSEVQLKKSICAVELLNLLTQYSKESGIINLLMKSIAAPSTFSHISNCIINASEEMVEKALHITASVGFYGRKASTNVAKALVLKRDRPLSIQDPPTHPSCQWNAASLTGATKLTETLRSISELVDGTNDICHDEIKMISDIFAWYRLSKEMHEHEIYNLNSHVFQQNKTIAHLKYLIERQTEFVSRRLGASDEKDLQIVFVQHKLEKTTKELDRIKSESTATIERLKETLRTKIDTLKDTSEKLQNLGAAHEKLCTESKEALKEKNSYAEKLKATKAENKDLNVEFTKTKKDLDLCKTKLAKLETEVKKKEDERLAITAMLEEKTKVLETIQGLMGMKNLK